MWCHLKISLKIIAQEITKGDVQIISTRKSNPDAMRLDHLRLWNKDETVEASACYIIDGGYIRHDLALPAGTALIVLGKCNQGIFSDLDADILLWQTNRKEMSFKDQFNTISEIFKYYQEIDNKIRDCLLANETLQNIIALGESMFHNMILLLDSSFSLLFETRKNNPLDWDHSGSPQVPTLPAETVEQIRINPEYRERKKNQGIFYISNEVLNCNTLFIQIQRDQLVFYIALLETEHPITNGHKQLLSAFSEYIFLSLRSRRFSNTKTMQFEYFISKLLINEKVEHSEITRQLFSKQWKTSDHYVCFILELNLWNRNDIDPYTICKMVENRFLGTFSFYYDDRTVCITNLNQSGINRSVFLQMLAPYVRDQLFHVGVSFEFSDFISLNHFYRQALAALDLGKKKNPDEWIYKFEKYALDYFIKYGTSKMDPRHLCSPDLLTLAQYDKENNTDLLHTLEMYLSYGLNATQTATELFIHRNTLYQRISKIESMIQGKLNNPSTRLYMQLSFTFMDFSGN